MGVRCLCMCGCALLVYVCMCVGPDDKAAANDVAFNRRDVCRGSVVSANRRRACMRFGLSNLVK